MGQGASAAGNSDLRPSGSTKQRQAKHRRSTRSLPDAALIRTNPANVIYPNASGRSTTGVDASNIPASTNSSTTATAYQPNSRRVGASAGGPNQNGIGSNGVIAYGQMQNELRDQELMKKYLHRDAAPYYVSTKVKPTGAPCGPRSLDINLNRQWGDNSHRYQKAVKAGYEDDTLPGSSNWSDVASDMFRISRPHHNDSVATDRSISDVQSDFVPPACGDRSVHRQNRGSSRRCQQKKSRRSEKLDQDRGILQSRRHENGEPDGGYNIDTRMNYRDCGGPTMTPVPENPYKEHQEYQKQMDDELNADRRGVVTKRSKSVHDCASSKRVHQLQPPSHPPPRPPKGKLHYYARLENEASTIHSQGIDGGVVEHWIDFPNGYGKNSGVEASPNRSASIDTTPTPKSPGSDVCDKLVIQLLRTEISAERSQCELNKQRVRQLENDVQKLNDTINELKFQRDEETTASKKKIDELTERCRGLNEDLQRAAEEKRQAEMRCNQEKSNYEDYMDNVANEVGRALTRQQTMKTECTRLQKRILEVEWENKVLKAQLRLTPMWSNSGTGITPPNGGRFPTMSSAATSFTAHPSMTPKSESNRFPFANVGDQQNNNADLAGIVYRKKSFREKMAGLHKYRQSMGSDPTLDQSGALNDHMDAAAFSIESLASFNDENEQFQNYDDNGHAAAAALPLPSSISSGRRFHQPRTAFLMVNAGEGLCSRPVSFNFDGGTTATGSSRPPLQPAQCPTNVPPIRPPHYRFNTGDNGQKQPIVRNHYTNTFVDNNAGDMEDEDEPVKNYAAMFGEESILSAMNSGIMNPATSTLSAIPQPIFNAMDPPGVQRNVGQELQNNSGNSSTETLNASSNLQANGNFFNGSPKRKLDVVVNMLTNIEMRNPFDPALWPLSKGQDEKKWKTEQFPCYGLLWDDGYSTMSSELYAVLDSAVRTRLKSGSSILCPPPAATEHIGNEPKPNLENYGKLVRSSSDGQLEEMNKIEKRILKKNEPSLNFDAFERDYATLLSASMDFNDPGYGIKDGNGAYSDANREALCDFDVDICIPPLDIDAQQRVDGDYILSTTNFSSTQTQQSNDSSIDQFPPDPSTFSVPNTRNSDAANSMNRSPLLVDQKRQPKPVQPRKHSNRYSRQSSGSSSTEDSDDMNGTVIEASKPSRRVAKLANASTSSTSTSFTSDDDEDSRTRVDESAKTTMQIWLKQLKIKRAGQKSGLVRYLPPECRPSILRQSVFARFGTEERRALASFDFLHQADTTPKSKTNNRSRSITDLYENLPYHERTGNVKQCGEAYFTKSRCSSRISFAATGSLSTLTSIQGSRANLGPSRSYSSSLFLSDFCNDEDAYSCSSSNSSLSFTFQ